MSASGVSVDLDKVKAVMSWEKLKSASEIHSFLGLRNTIGGSLRISSG